MEKEGRNLRKGDASEQKWWRCNERKSKGKIRGARFWGRRNKGEMRGGDLRRGSQKTKVSWDLKR